MHLYGKILLLIIIFKLMKNLFNQDVTTTVYLFYAHQKHRALTARSQVDLKFWKNISLYKILPLTSRKSWDNFVLKSNLRMYGYRYTGLSKWWNLVGLILKRVAQPYDSYGMSHASWVINKWRNKSNKVNSTLLLHLEWVVIARQLSVGNFVKAAYVITLVSATVMDCAL